MPSLIAVESVAEVSLGVWWKRLRIHRHFHGVTLWFLMHGWLILVLSLAGCAVPAPRPLSGAVLAIPAQSDWIDYGPIFEGGALGEWDYTLWGGFTGTAVKKDGTYYLYYQGARGYRTSFDETVTWRAIGVATSPDGISFTKWSDSPVVTWFPTMEGEEGAASGAHLLKLAEIGPILTKESGL